MCHRFKEISEVKQIRQIFIQSRELPLFSVENKIFKNPHTEQGNPIILCREQNIEKLDVKFSCFVPYNILPRPTETTSDSLISEER